MPAARWLRRYERRDLTRDLAGGLAVGSLLIPQGLAFAQIVRVPPVAGLWSGIAAMIGYALFGPSRHLMVGPEAGTAMMVAAVLTSAGIEPPEQRLGAAALLAVMIGFVLVIAGAGRLGAIADFLSRPIRITLALAEPHAPMRGVLRRSGLREKLGAEDVFSTVGEAIRAYVDRARGDLGRDVDWQRVEEPARPSRDGR